MNRRALRFDDEAAFRRALEVLEALSDEGPFAYDLTADPFTKAGIVVMPVWSFNRLMPVLAGRGIPYFEMTVTSMSDLPPAKQAELRGLKWGSRTVTSDLIP